MNAESGGVRRNGGLPELGHNHSRERINYALMICIFTPIIIFHIDPSLIELACICAVPTYRSKLISHRLIGPFSLIAE